VLLRLLLKFLLRGLVFVVGVVVLLHLLLNFLRGLVLVVDLLRQMVKEDLEFVRDLPL
jgi:hypothetical protein